MRLLVGIDPDRAGLDLAGHAPGAGVVAGALPVAEASLPLPVGVAAGAAIGTAAALVEVGATGAAGVASRLGVGAAGWPVGGVGFTCGALAAGATGIAGATTVADGASSSKIRSRLFTSPGRKMDITGLSVEANAPASCPVYARLYESASAWLQ